MVAPFTLDQGDAVLTVSSPQYVAELSLRGATLTTVDYSPKTGLTFRLLDGYADPNEQATQDGVRNGILAPFTNRIADGRYRFNSTEHDLLPGKNDRLIYHGLVREQLFTIDSIDATRDDLTVSLSCHLCDAPGYPFTIDIEVRYVFRTAGIDITITGHNLGTSAAPYASGWHPYFRLPGLLETWELTIPAQTWIRASSDLIPLAGPDAFASITPDSAMNFDHVPIGDAVLDVCLADLVFSSSGRIETSLHDPESGHLLTIWQSRGYMHVFTGDTLARGRRASIALEPVEALTNAFNRSDMIDAITLQPGTRREFEFGFTLQEGKTA